MDISYDISVSDKFYMKQNVNQFYLSQIYINICL